MTNNRKRLLATWAALILCVVLGVYVYLMTAPGFIVDKANPVTLQLKGIALMVVEYCLVYGELPGDDAKKIGEALRGENPDSRQFVFDRHYNSDGMLADVYGTTLEIEITSPTVSLRSAGQNRIHGDGDDVVLNKGTGYVIRINHIDCGRGAGGGSRPSRAFHAG